MRSAPLMTGLVLLTACSPREITELTPELEEVVRSNNGFSLELYDAVAADTDENLFLSPFSVNTALSMTYAGAEGETESQMAELLKVVDESDHHANLGLLTQDLGGVHAGRAYQLHVANRLFGQQDAAWNTPFLDVTEQDYGAPLEELDFEGDPEGSRQYINDWGSQQTKGLIDDILPAGSINSSTRLALANAIYFKADWLDAFQKDDTGPAAFQLADGTSVDVDMMRGEMDLRIGGTEDVVVAGLPYQDEELAFWVVMPSDPAGLATLEAELDAEQLAAWMDEAYDNEDVAIQLPRFEMKSTFALKQPLTDLGMVDAFGDNADFTGMTDAMPLFIDDVHHQAYVKVDEEGTTAAAVTVVVANEYSMAGGPVVVDRPFLFFIRDELTGTLLFMGRMSDPSLAAVP